MAANTDPARKPPGIGEFWFNELRHAIRDIRQKLLDEGWFGRRSASNTQADGFTVDLNRERDTRETVYGHSMSFDEQWAVREPSQEKPSQAREIGVDR